MFNYAKFLKNGGNFTFIAENVAAIYRALELTSFGHDLSLGRHLYATALIDTVAYLRSGQFESSDLELATLNAMINRISIMPYERKVYPMFGDLSYHQELVCLAMQLEAMIAFADNKITYTQAIDIVMSKKDLIESTIHRAVCNPAKLEIFETVQANVDAIVENKSFRDQVLAFDDGSNLSNAEPSAATLCEVDKRIARMRIPNPANPGHYFTSMDELEDYSRLLHEAEARRGNPEQCPN